MKKEEALLGIISELDCIEDESGSSFTIVLSDGYDFEVGSCSMWLGGEEGFGSDILGNISYSNKKRLAKDIVNYVYDELNEEIMDID